jgi:hypothetical protein
MLIVQIAAFVLIPAYVAWTIRSLTIASWNAARKGELLSGTDALRIAAQPLLKLFDKFVVKPIAEIADKRGNSKKVKGK